MRTKLGAEVGPSLTTVNIGRNFFLGILQTQTNAIGLPACQADTENPFLEGSGPTA